MQKDSQEHGMVVRGQRMTIGRWGKRSLETRVGQECSISRGKPDCTVEVYMSEESEEGVTVLRQGGQPRALNLEREICEHLRWTHLEQAQHCTDMPH